MNVSEYLFYDFLTNPAGDQMAELDRLHDDLLAQLEIGELNAKSISDFKVAALQAGFGGGYAVAEKVQQAKYRLALQNHRRRA